MSKESVRAFLSISEKLKINYEKKKSFIVMLVVLSLWGLPTALIEDNLRLYVPVVVVIWTLFITLILYCSWKENTINRLYVQCMLMYLTIIGMLAMVGVIFISIRAYLWFGIVLGLWLFTLIMRLFIVKRRLIKGKYLKTAPLWAEISGMGSTGVIIFGIRPILKNTIQSNFEASLILAILLFIIAQLLTICENTLYQIYFGKRVLGKEFQEMFETEI